MTASTKFYHMTQIILWMWLRDQSLVTLAFLQEKLSKPHNLGLALGTNLKFYTSL